MCVQPAHFYVSLTSFILKSNRMRFRTFIFPFTSPLPGVAVAILAWGIDDNFTLAEELHFCYF